MDSLMTLLLAPPSSGKTSLLLALAGMLDSDLKLSGRITYNGHGMEEFVPHKTSTYISQHDLHIPEMMVRETLAFSARCQGVGTRYEMLKELSRREKEANIKPDPDFDVYMKRDAATFPNVWDRVPYVIIKAAKGAKAYERLEDLIYVLENNIPIDPQYYLQNQLSKVFGPQPLLRIFEPLLKNASIKHLHGSHTRVISISTPSNSGIMKFAKKQLTVIGCITPIRNYKTIWKERSHCRAYQPCFK